MLHSSRRLRRRLIVAAGPVLRPHYRHKDGMDGCALADDGARAERSYEHLRYQRALLAWLADQGCARRWRRYWEPTAERTCTSS